MASETSSEPAQVLPVVEHDDLLHTAFDPAENDNAGSRWDALLMEQPHLARELLDSITRAVPNLESREQVFDQMSFMYSALRTAVTRAHEKDTSTDVPQSIPEIPPAA